VVVVATITRFFFVVIAASITRFFFFIVVAASMMFKGFLSGQGLTLLGVVEVVARCTAFFPHVGVAALRSLFEAVVIVQILVTA